MKNPCLSVSLLEKETIMYGILNRIIKPIALSIVFLFLLGFGYIESHAGEASMAKADQASPHSS